MQNQFLWPRNMTPPWTNESSRAAIAEGWEIFDCDDSSCGRWQLDNLDCPEDWRAMTGGVVPPALDSELAAWEIVANGTKPHHIAAREFLQAHNPQEYERVMSTKKDPK